MSEFVNPNPSKYDFELDASGKPNGGLVCKACKGEVQGRYVTRPVWFKNGPGPCAGGGETVTEQVPYCPKCEKEPDWRGSPVYT